MPDISWTEEDHKKLWRTLRASVWTLVIVLALLFLFKLWEIPAWLGPWVFVLYFVALWVIIYKVVRARWGA